MKTSDTPPANICLADYPQLRLLAWHIPDAVEVTPKEALSLYERNWRHLDQASLDERERSLIAQLAQEVGNGHLFV